MAFKMGDRLRLISNDGISNNLFPIGSVGTAQSDSFIGNDEETEYVKIKYDHHNPVCTHKVSRFELVIPELPQVQPAPGFEVGDVVHIVKKASRPDCSWVSPEMDKFLNDGVDRKIIDVSHFDNFLVEGGEDWYFVAESLKLVKRVKKVVKKKPRANEAPSPNLRAEMYKKGKEYEGGICTFAAKAEDNRLSIHVGAICHAALNRMFDPHTKIKELAYSVRWEVERHKMKGDKLKAFKQYVKYVLNESPWSSAFLTKRIETAFRYDILMDVSKSSHRIAGACIALREGSEYWYRAELFHKVLNKGFSGHVAYLMSYIFNPADKEFEVSNLNRGHCALSGSFNIEELIKFFKNGYTLDEKEQPFRTHHRGYTVHKWIAPICNEKNLYDWVNKTTKYNTRGEGWNTYKYIDEEEFFKVAKKLEQLFKEAE